MADPFIAEIRAFGFNFAPRGWAACDGQILPLSQNTALFALLGTTYGGNGFNNFALPDLQGRMPLQQGQGPGLTNRFLGEETGVEAVTLLQTQIPAHTHTVQGTTEDATTPSPAGALYASTAPTAPLYARTAADTTLAPQAIAVAGGGQPHNNLPPYLVLNYCIALQGIFPPRS